ARLDSPESASRGGQLEAETQALQSRVSRLTAEGTGRSVACTGTDCEGEQALRVAPRAAGRSKVASLRASPEQARREAAEAAATIQSLQGSLALAQKQVAM